MKTRSAAAWVLLSIALIAGYWYTGTLEEEKQRAVFEAKRLFDFEGEDVVWLSITTRENDAIEAKRLGENEWKLDEPYAHVYPNHALWTNLAENVPLLINQRSIEASPDELALYGLDDPPLTIVIGTSRKDLIQLDVGTADPTQNHHYAKLASGEVFLLPAPMAQALYRSMDELRDRRVFPAVDYTVDRIHYKRFTVDVPDDGLEPIPGIDEEYVLGDDDEWRITQPIDVLAFQGEMLHLTNQVQYLSSFDFIPLPDALGDYGLDPPWAKLSVMNTKEEAEQTLLLGWHDDMADDGRMFAAIEGNPAVFTIDAAFLSYLPQDPLDYREDHIFTGKAINLASIEYADMNRQFTLTSDDVQGWMLTDPAYSDTDNLAVSKLIDLMKRIAGSRFPDEDEVGRNFGSDRIKFTFHYKDGSPSTSISIGGTVPDSVNPVMFYVRQDFGSVTTIEFPWVQFLELKPFRFRKRDLLSFDPRSATALSIRLDGITYSLEEQNGVWNVLQPANHAVENIEDVGTLLMKLRSAYARDIVKPVPAIDVMGLEEPFFEAEVTYTTPDGEKVVGPLTLGNLTARSSRDRFGRVSGRPETFYVDHGLIEDLRIGLQGIRPVEE